MSNLLARPELLAPLVLTAILVFALAVFALRVAFVGRPHTGRIEQVGGSVLLSRYLMEFGLWLGAPVIRLGVGLGVHPDVFSWASLGLHVAAGAVIAAGWFSLGAWLIGVGALCDALDGAVAREAGLASDAGEMLDAVVDRWAEMAVFFGFVWYYRSLPWGFLLAAGACAAAVMVSYARAKAESMGVSASMGLMQRHERAVWLGVATFASGLWELWSPTPPGAFAVHPAVLVALAAIALLGTRTACLRTHHARALLQRADAGAKA